MLLCGVRFTIATGQCGVAIGGGNFGVETTVGNIGALGSSQGAHAFVFWVYLFPYPCFGGAIVTIFSRGVLDFVLWGATFYCAWVNLFGFFNVCPCLTIARDWGTCFATIKCIGARVLGFLGVKLTVLALCGFGTVGFFNNYFFRGNWYFYFTLWCIRVGRVCVV